MGLEEHAVNALRDMARRVADAGRRGDTMLAHITPEEARMLKARGGAGTRNPKTGLLEFWSSSPGSEAAAVGGMSPADRDTAYGGGGAYGSGGDGGGIEISRTSSRQLSPEEVAQVLGNAGFGDSLFDSGMSVGGWLGAQGTSGFVPNTFASSLSPFPGLAFGEALDPVTVSMQPAAAFSPTRALTDVASMALGIPGITSLAEMAGVMPDDYRMGTGAPPSETQMASGDGGGGLSVGSMRQASAQPAQGNALRSVIPWYVGTIQRA